MVPVTDRDSRDVRHCELTDGTTAPTAGTGSISVDGSLTGAFEVAAEVSIENLNMPLPARTSTSE